MLISAPLASPAVAGWWQRWRWAPPSLGVWFAVIRCLMETGFFSGITSAGAAGSAPTWKTWLRDPSEQDNGSFLEAVL